MRHLAYELAKSINAICKAASSQEEAKALIAQKHGKDAAEVAEHMAEFRAIPKDCKSRSNGGRSAG